MAFSVIGIISCTVAMTPAPTPAELAQQEVDQAKQREEDAVKSANIEKIGSKATKILSERLVEADVIPQLVNSVSVTGSINSDVWTAEIVVNNIWHAGPYQTRLQLAQNLQKIFAKLASPVEAHDYSRIKLVDINGNEVGGSSWIAGTSIWVSEK